MPNVSPNEYVPAMDLKTGDRVLYADLVVEVAGVTGATWVENGDHVHGVEVECRDAGGTARLFLYRPSGHLFERIAR